ncbi:GNAT family N-acetyltransferase [Ornithinimicrobium tianjinense]|uniref:GNAT family acetyltransferase n=1 Tax=Ornithinimicrobium tianjinense TaxID=1195761 RepID=A0A917BIH3_9MICO|nr:GNAT family N-acetyltransferase [Ornithinimicrobium tianjinense]GGF47161.1 GNAT family acetyltransferase [Ornithinimicrobium tianjinense]
MDGNDGGATVTAYTWRHLEEGDVPAWAALVNHLAEVDGTEEFYREEDLREELGHDGVDPARDTVAAWDGDVMVAYGSVVVPRSPDHEGQGRAFIGGGVRAEHRGRGLGREVMDRTEPRAVELLEERHPDATSFVRAYGMRPGSSAERMMERRGYRVVRYFNELKRPLDTPVEVPPVDGAQLVSPGGEHEEPTRLAHNEAFKDHWGSGPQTAESWHENWTGGSARPALSTVAVAPDGQVLAYVLCSEWVDRHLYVNLVGTVREARGRGLAQAALLRSIDLGTRSGDYDVIELGVDSENPSGATRLYEKVGFVHNLQTMSMQRDLPL